MSTGLAFSTPSFASVAADDYFNASRVYTSFQKLKPGCARILVKTTYELEGDRLEILLTYDRIEGLRALGRAMLRQDTKVILP